ncbi:RusA-like Holliday junction resolvase [Vibrio phage 1.097.O._10N.286.49.B3]|uniref:RusA-like crossover junction endodeoxyribonuclease n=1 Tax=Vibrio phage 1.097.O._10N.286.49.B3 TaxID=1881383 RepID=A0A2I7R0K1_9CAUD|nr:RusA-like Holliday junction resolvase [Vibrio phage 1.097.O._10N.286.49.B3]AUR87177.1 RusA-like crossover junction endodeoxyribonuclease [Vibrio phage 1.097.O._10N.286.49.B3]
MTQIVTAPTAVFLTRKTKKDKRIPISLSWYRNSHHRENNEVKKYYKVLMKPQIDKLPKYIKPEITYVWFSKDKRKGDLGNHTAIHQKFFEDALVELGHIDGDDWRYITNAHQSFGGFDKDNPRVEIHIKETHVRDHQEP